MFLERLGVLLVVLALGFWMGEDDERKSSEVGGDSRRDHPRKPRSGDRKSDRPRKRVKKGTDDELATGKERDGVDAGGRAGGDLPGELHGNRPASAGVGDGGKPDPAPVETPAGAA